VPGELSDEGNRDLSPTIRSGLRRWFIFSRCGTTIQASIAVGRKTPGLTAIGVFLFFGAVMASLAATTLLWRGTAPDRAWDLNPTAYKQIVPLGGMVGILFRLLGAALTTAGIGWFRRRLWGW
jgi:hypothetical protein